MLSSVTADGGTEIASIVTAVSPKANVMVNRDPNHYAKGLAKHVTNLCHEHPALNVVVASLKAHFLIGMYSALLTLVHTLAPHVLSQLPLSYRYQKIQEK